jgi:hypothetical protein
MKAWTDVIHSTSENAYENNWNILQQKYDPLISGLVQYIHNTWICLWKRSIIQAYTDKALHFCNHVTLWVKSLHSTVKTYLQVSTGNLKMVYDSISLLLSNQFMAYKAEVVMNKSRAPHTVRDALYA